MRVRLLLPTTALTLLVAPAAASAAFVHTIVPGESLYSIAAADGLSVGQLAAANGIAPSAQLTAGSTVAIPPQAGPATPATTASTTPAGAFASTSDTDADSDDTGSAAATPVPVTGTAPGLSGDGDADSDDPVSSTTATTARVSTTASAGAGSYVVQPGDTLSAIAARAGTSIAQLAASNGLSPSAPLPAGIALRLSPATSPASTAPAQPPAVGTSIVGRMTWFGGPHDPGAQGIPASGLGWRTDGMSYYNNGSLGHHWMIHFPWGQTLPMTQIDIGPAPWTGNPFDIAASALPNTPFNWRTWPNPIVTGTYQGG